MKRIVWAISAAFVLAGCRDSTAPEVAARAEVSASDGPRVVCTASVPPQCEIKPKPPKP